MFEVVATHSLQSTSVVERFFFFPHPTAPSADRDSTASDSDSCVIRFRQSWYKMSSLTINTRNVRLLPPVFIVSCLLGSQFPPWC